MRVVVRINASVYHVSDFRVDERPGQGRFLLSNAVAHRRQQNRSQLVIRSESLLYGASRMFFPAELQACLAG
jgi:hypothetical protein